MHPHPRLQRALAAACVGTVALLGASTALAQDQSFAYVGYLDRDGSAVDEVCDFKVFLYADPAGAASWQQDRPDIQVHAGQFAFVIGPVPQAQLASRSLWVGLSVKKDTDPDLPASWVALQGKQQLTSTLSAAHGVPAGTIVAFGGTGVPAGWLRCDGGGVKSASYPELFAAIGTRWGNGTDHCASAPCQFNLPNLRGRFLRGDFHTDTPDPDPTAHYRLATGGATSGIGAYQDDANLSHGHTLGNLTVNNTGSTHKHQWRGYWTMGRDGSSDTVRSRAWQNGDPLDDVTATDGAHTHGLSGALDVTGGVEARPDNALVGYIIKY